MNGLIDWLRLHPVLTQRGIRVGWYLYLLGAIIQLASYLSFSFNAPVGYDLRYYVVTGGPLIRIVADVIMVRIFLEIALRYLFPRNVSLLL